MRYLDKPRLRDRLEWRLQKDISENRLFGAALHVFQNGETVYNNAMGFADAAGKIPVTDQTIFRIASMTKPITAVATLILAERNLISLDDCVDKYLPSYSKPTIACIDEEGGLVCAGEAEKVPTIRNILSHTSGIGSGKTGAAQIRRMKPEDKRTLQASVSFFSRQGLSFEPGTRQEYSGFPSFDVLTAIIEEVTDEDYYRFLNREIFLKCEMEDTVFIPGTSQLERMSVMHNRVNGENSVCEMPEGSIFEGIPWGHSLGGAGLVSTLHDYSNFAQMLVQDGIYNGHRILSADSVSQIGTPQVSSAVQPGSQRWGLGVRVIVSDAYKMLPIGSYGWSGAYGPHFWIDPVNRIAAVYMKNSYYDPGAGSVTGYHFEQDVYDCMV